MVPRLVPGVVFALGVTLSPALLRAQETEPVAGHSMHGEVFNEGPRQSAYLMPGCGDVHFPITTRDTRTQKFFRQGVGQLHGFWHFEAERSFRQAAAFDPTCAMAYWGMAMANVDNPDRAAGFMEEAVRRRAQASAREQMWIDMLAKFYEVDAAKLASKPAVDGVVLSAKGKPVEKGKVVPAAASKTEKKDASGSKVPSGKPEKRKFKKSKKLRSRELVRGYEAILHKYPDDVEAMAFLANRLWLNNRAGLSTNSHLVVELMLRRVFEKSPNHPAHHYRIHLWDREDAKRALISAQVSGQSAPAVAHQWHMSGHIFAKLHRHEDAVYQQSASARVDHAHMMRDRVMPYKIHNYGHNNEWLCRSLNHCGRATDALALAQNLADLPRHPEKNKVSRRGSISGYGVRRLIETCRNYLLVEPLLDYERRGYLEGGDNKNTELAVVAETAEAFLLAGRVDLGRKQIAKMEVMLTAAKKAAAAKKKAKKASKPKSKGKAKVAAGKTSPYRRGRSRTGMPPVSVIEKRIKGLRGLIAAHEGKAEEAQKLLKGSRLAKHCLAMVYSKIGDHKKARELVDAEAKKNPNRTEIVARQVWVRYHAGDKGAAKEAFDGLRLAAATADFDTPVLTRLAKIAKEFGYPEDWRTPRTAPDDVGVRPDLDSLGPFRWQPSPAPGFRLPKARGGSIDLEDYRGKPVLVIFYLGFGCLHCVEQLQHFHPMIEEYRKAGIEIVAVSTDSMTGMSKSVSNVGPDQFGFPLLADPKLDVFRRWGVYDDFEKMALHGTFLVDGKGLVRWSDISYEPFDQPKYLLQECKRLLKQKSE